MIEDNAAYLARVADFHKHVSEVGLSWTDDSVTLICQRESCMEHYEIAGTRGRMVWWQRDIPYLCTPEIAAELRNKHVRGEF